MARISLLLCFTFLVVSGTLLEFVSPTFLPAIEEPKTLKDVEPYTVKVVMTFAIDLEKECPKTQEFKVFFERVKAFAKYVCPIARATRRRDAKAYESDMKAKAGSLFQAMSAFAARKSESGEVMILRREQREAMNIVGSLQSIVSKFMNRRYQAESDESIELTVEQKQAIKDRITRWQQVITRVAKTMVQASADSSTQTQTQESSQNSAVNVNGGSEVSMNKGEDNKGANGGSTNGKTTENQGSNANSKTDTNAGNGGDSALNTSVGIQGGSQGSVNGSTTVDSTKGGQNDSTTGKTSDNKGGNGGSTNGKTTENKGSNASSTTDTNAGNGGDSAQNTSAGIQGGAQGSVNGSTTVDSTKGGNNDSTKDKTADNKGGNGGSTNGAVVDNKGSNAKSTTDNNAGNKGDSTKNTSTQGSANGNENSNSDTKGGSENVTSSSATETHGNAANASTSTSIDANTSDEVMGFILTLEKKCPATEEFKAFFEKMKAYMRYACSISSMVGKKNPRAYMSEMISIAAKLSDSMALVRARMSKSRETKTTMQNYQQEMMKTLNVLQDVTSNVVNENQSKKDGSITVTETQQKVIKETITRWEQVTTQFVETAVQSETQSSTTTKSSTQGSSAENRKTKSLKLNGEATITH